MIIGMNGKRDGLKLTSIAHVISLQQVNIHWILMSILVQYPIILIVSQMSIVISV